MGVEDFLITGEHVKHKIQRGGNVFYATNKRVIKYSKKFFGLLGIAFDDLPYMHITSISLVNTVRLDVVFFGILLIIIGGLNWFIPEVTSFFDRMPIGRLAGENVSYVLAIAGGIVVIIGISLRKSFYQFRAAGIKPEDWKIESPNASGAKDFVRTVREYLNN